MADKGGGINANAMYQAGFASKAEVNTQQEAIKERKREFWGGVAKEAYNILGTAAVGQIQKNYKQYQKMSNAQESNSANVLLEIKKFPKDNEALVQDLADLKEKHRAATKTATVGFGKKRSKAKAAALMYLQQLKDFDLWLKGVAENRLEAQGMTSVGAGTTQGSAEQGGMSPGAGVMEEGNTVEFALGGIHQRLRWNSETGQGEVQVGGEWLEDKASGKQKYSDKAETGTYEEYVAEDADMAYQTYKNDNIESPNSPEYTGEIMTQEEWSKSQGLNTSLLSREEWTKQNQESRGLVSRIPYSQMKFAKKEDKIVGNNIILLDAELAKQAMKKGSVDWEYISETQNGKKQFAGTINSYTNAQFKDFFFGGFSFDYANDRMPETAPAYILLKEDPAYADQLNEGGSFKEGFGPGNVDWEGRLLNLKGQSFVKGSLYRQQVIDQQWEKRKEKYEANQKAYRDANPEDPQWKKDGYANKKQFLDAQKDSGNPVDAPEDDIGEDSGFDQESPTGGDSELGIDAVKGVSRADKDARRNSLLNFESFTGEHYEYRFDAYTRDGVGFWKAYSINDPDEYAIGKPMKGSRVATIEGLQGTEDTSPSTFNTNTVNKNNQKIKNETPSTPGGVTQKILSETTFDSIKGLFDKKGDGGIFDKSFGDDYVILNTLMADDNNQLMPVKDRLIFKNKKTGKEITVLIGPRATTEDAEMLNRIMSEYIMAGKEPQE
tara:strand:+ start:2216 stop:4378 length:2163 start_codon:yes stop_codon:yes gene_type:complete